MSDLSGRLILVDKEVNMTYPVYAIATWSVPADPGPGDHMFEWAVGLKDHRRSRVLAHIQAFGIPCDPDTLVIKKVRP